MATSKQVDMEHQKGDLAMNTPPIVYAHSAAIVSARQAAIYTPIVPRP